VVRWSYRATHRRGELFGVPAAGKQVCVSGISIYRIADGKVTEESGVVDNFSLMLQLGVLPESW
jgi:predicted ester cyclase